MSNKAKPQGIVDADIISTLSHQLFQNAMGIYHELIQNACDAYQAQNTPAKERRIDVTVDNVNKKIAVRDYAGGVEPKILFDRLSVIGGSHKKRLEFMRGSMGIGRLTPLAYCQRLIFRARYNNGPIEEMIWDAELLRDLSSSDDSLSLDETYNRITERRKVEIPKQPANFFEVEMVDVLHHLSDKNNILDERFIGDYLSTVAPVPFHNSFDIEHRKAIQRILGDYLYEVLIFINKRKTHLTRPHRNSVISPVDGKTVAHISKIVSIHEVLNSGVQEKVDDSLMRGWIGVTTFSKALPIESKVDGLRVRVGNMQIGDSSIFDKLFGQNGKQSWMNSRVIGEIHVTNKKIKPTLDRKGFAGTTEYLMLREHINTFALQIKHRIEKGNKEDDVLSEAENEPRPQGAANTKSAERKKLVAEIKSNVIPVMHLKSGKFLEILEILNLHPAEVSDKIVIIRKRNRPQKANSR